jgi:hypothetical protein
VQQTQSNPTTPSNDRLTAAEIESLRRDLQESSAWIQQELARQVQPKPAA